MHKCPLFYDEHILKHTKVILILFKQVTKLTRKMKMKQNRERFKKVVFTKSAYKSND